MATKNDITGDYISTKVNSDSYRYNWDRIFGNKHNELGDYEYFAHQIDACTSFPCKLYYYFERTNSVTGETALDKYDMEYYRSASETIRMCDVELDKDGKVVFPVKMMKFSRYIDKIPVFN